MGSPEIDPCNYRQLNFDKGSKVIQWTNESSQQIVLENLEIYAQKNGYAYTLHLSKKKTQNGS